MASASTLPRPDEAVDDMSRRLARPEAGDARLLREVAVGGGEVAVDLGRRDLDLEDDPRSGLGSRGDGDQGVLLMLVRWRRRPMVGEARLELARLCDTGS